MRKFTALLVLGLMLLAGCKKAPKGYDIATCSFGGFAAVHVTMTPEGFQVDSIAEGPGRVVALTTEQGSAFKRGASDKEGTHYYDIENTRFEVVLNGSVGLFKVNGQVHARLFLFEDAVGSKLDSNARKQFENCRPIIQGLTGLTSDATLN